MKLTVAKLPAGEAVGQDLVVAPECPDEVFIGGTANAADSPVITSKLPSAWATKLKSPMRMVEASASGESDRRKAAKLYICNLKGRNAGSTWPQDRDATEDDRGHNKVGVARLHARRNTEYDASPAPPSAKKEPRKVVGEFGQVVLNATCFLQEGDITLARERVGNPDLAHMPEGGQGVPSVASEAGRIPRPKNKRSMKRMRATPANVGGPLPPQRPARSGARAPYQDMEWAAMAAAVAGETSDAGMISRMVTFSASGLSFQRTVSTVLTEFLA